MTTLVTAIVLSVAVGVVVALAVVGTARARRARRDDEEATALRAGLVALGSVTSAARRETPKCD